MSLYYERLMKCRCGYVLRQTTKRLPLDKTATAMEYVHSLHRKCKARRTYTEWKLGNEYFSPYHKKYDKNRRVYRAVDLLK